MDDTTPAVSRSAASALFDIGLATLVGALAVRAPLGDTASEWALRCARRCRRLFVHACALALVASLGWMVLEALAMTQAPLREALPAIGGSVADTPFGRAWAVATAALATAALAVVVLTGGASVWHGLGASLAPLATSAWGGLRDAKLVLVGAAIALGGFNRFVVMPALPRTWPRFAGVLRVEAGVLLAALVAAAWLANGEPPQP